MTSTDRRRETDNTWLLFIFSSFFEFPSLYGNREGNVNKNCKNIHENAYAHFLFDLVNAQTTTAERRNITIDSIGYTS